MNRCIGFGASEDACDNPADAPPFLWCAECDRRRRAALTLQFARIEVAYPPPQPKP